MVIEVTSPTIIEPPSELTVRPGGGVLFAADDGVNGRELWVSDGTAGGTTLFTNIAAGPTASNPQNLRVLGSTVYFAADDGVNGSELWKSDGTAPGTVMVANLNAGAASSTPGPVGAGNGGVLYFSADDGTNGRELWRTDGTNAGTTFVANVRAGAASSDPSEFVDFNGATYFVGNRSSANPQHPPGAVLGALYRTDGTGAGTMLGGFIDGDLHLLVSDAAALKVQGGSLYFRAQSFDGGWQVCRWDGNTGTGPLAPAVVELLNFMSAPNPVAFTAFGFVTAENADVVRYSYDAVPVRTVLNVPGAAATNPFHSIWANSSWLFFNGNTPGAGVELMAAPVSAVGMALVQDINTTTNYDNTPSGEISRITVFNASALVTTAGTLRPTELWISDGTDIGTTLLATYPAGDRLTAPFAFSPLALTFHQVPLTGTQTLLVTNGSTTTELSTFLTGQYEPYCAALDGRTYFNGNTLTEGEEMWRTDGTLPGTVRVTDLAPGADFSRINAVKTAGPWVYFTASTLSADSLQRVNSAGTVDTVVLPPGQLPRLLGAVGTRMILARNTGQIFSVGAGAGDVVELNVGNPLVVPAFGNAAVRAGRLYFPANDFGALGQELWSTDGTVAGTSVVKDIIPGATGSSASLLAEGSDRINFAAFDGVDFGLWRSDGTIAGTTKVTGTTPFELASRNTSAWFTSSDPVNGFELWKSDGTGAGTSVLDIEPGAESSFPSLLTPVSTWRGPVLFFAAATTGHALELWSFPATTGNAYSMWSDMNGGVGAPDGDLDGDGIPNLLEWALGLTPGASDPAPVEIGVVGVLPSATFKTLTPIPPGLTYIIEKSLDLITWVPVVRIDSGGAVIIPPAGVTLSGPIPGPKPGTQCFSASLPAGALGFLRVRVTFEF